MTGRDVVPRPATSVACGSPRRYLVRRTDQSTAEQQKQHQCKSQYKMPNRSVRRSRYSPIPDAGASSGARRSACDGDRRRIRPRPVGLRPRCSLRALGGIKHSLINEPPRTQHVVTAQLSVTKLPNRQPLSFRCVSARAASAWCIRTAAVRRRDAGSGAPRQLRSVVARAGRWGLSAAVGRWLPRSPSTPARRGRMQDHLRSIHSDCS